MWLTRLPPSASVAYIRFSSDEQAKGDPVERQSEHIEAYASRNGLEIVEIVKDEGYSASKGEHLKHGLGRILERASKGEFKGFALVVERLDRLSRLGIAETNALIGKLLNAGLVIHVTQEGRVIKNQNDLVTVIMNTIGAFADAEYSKKLSERIGSAWAKKKDAAISNGKALTKNVPPWLEFRDNKIVEVTEASGAGRTQKIPVAVIQEMFRLASLGIGCKNICRTLGDQICTRVWVSQTLRSRAVLGEFVCNGEVLPDYFPRVIDQSLFDEVQRQMDLKQKNPGGNYRKSTTADNLFTGLLYDATDDEERALHFCNPIIKGKAYGYLVSKFDKQLGQNRIRYSKIEPAVLAFLTQEDWSAIAGASESDEVISSKAELTTVENEVGRAERQIETTVAAMDEADVATLRIRSARQAKLEAALTILTERRNELAIAVDAAIGKIRPLYEPQVLLNLIKQSEGADMRLRLRTELRKRIARISLVFGNEDYQTSFVQIEYSNGVRHFAALEADGRLQLVRDIDFLAMRAAVKAAVSS